MFGRTTYADRLVAAREAGDRMMAKVVREAAREHDTHDSLVKRVKILERQARCGRCGDHKYTLYLYYPPEHKYLLAGAEPFAWFRCLECRADKGNVFSKLRPYEQAVIKAATADWGVGPGKPINCFKAHVYTLSRYCPDDELPFAEFTCLSFWQHVYKKPLSDLNLQEQALVDAVINQASGHHD